MGPVDAALTGWAGTGQLDRPLHALAVCTGNICRSPAAERLLARHLGGDGSVLFSSAGTYARLDEPIAEPMADLLRLRGADPERFRSRQVTAELVEQADLIIALAREHRSAVVTLAPRSLHRTITLLGLADAAQRVLSGSASDTGRGSPTSTGELAMSQRLGLLCSYARGGGARVGPSAARPDVLDPWGRNSSAYGESLEQIDAAVQQIAAACLHLSSLDSAGTAL